MKSKGLAVVSMLCLVAILGVVVANGEEYALKANIPFDFLVGANSLSSGDYAITRSPVNSSVYVIKSSRTGAMVLTTPAGQFRGQGNKLVFNHYGDRYFISAIWLADLGLVYEVPKSKMEREMIAKGASPTIELIAANFR